MSPMPVVHRVEFIYLSTRDRHGKYPRISAELRWAPWRPHEVEVTFYPMQVTWSLSCDLLTDALTGPAGMGDVTFLPHFRDSRYVEMVLNSPDGRAGLKVQRRVLADFLTALPESDYDVAGDVEEWLRAGGR